MMTAHWHIEARFGHELTLIDLVKRSHREIGTPIGWTPNKLRIATGSVGARIDGGAKGGH